jgi:hypothetical protein
MEYLPCSPLNRAMGFIDGVPKHQSCQLQLWCLGISLKLIEQGFEWIVDKFRRIIEEEEARVTVMLPFWGWDISRLIRDFEKVVILCALSSTINILF